MRPMYPGLLVITILTLSGTALNLVSPWIYREIVNFLISGELSSLFGRYIHVSEPFSVLMWLIGVLVVVAVVNEIFNATESYMQTITSFRSFKYFSLKTFAKLQTLSVSYFDKTSPGALRERTAAGINEMFGITRNLVAEIMPIAVTFVVAVIVLI